jgi:hypothetical protein
MTGAGGTTTTGTRRFEVAGAFLASTGRCRRTLIELDVIERRVCAGMTGDVAVGRSAVNANNHVGLACLAIEHTMA